MKGSHLFSGEGSLVEEFVVVLKGISEELAGGLFDGGLIGPLTQNMSQVLSHYPSGAGVEAVDQIPDEREEGVPPPWRYVGDDGSCESVE